MSVVLDELIKATESLKISHQLLNQSLKKDPKNTELHKALRDSCIQRFEYCVELAWKTSMKVLGLDTKAPNPAVREMAQNKLIEDPELWLNFVIARNKTSHAYEEEMAQLVYQEVERILPELSQLILQLKERT